MGRNADDIIGGHGGIGGVAHPYILLPSPWLLLASRLPPAADGPQKAGVTKSGHDHRRLCGARVGGGSEGEEEEESMVRCAHVEKAQGG